MGDFVPTTHRGGEQQNQMTSVFDEGQKIISGATAECESRLESNLGAQESKLSNNQRSGWGRGKGTGVFFHIARGCTFHTDRKYKETQQPRLCYKRAGSAPKSKWWQIQTLF